MLRNRIGKDLLIFDGAIGTQLQSAGLKAGDIPEELNIRQPELLKRFTKIIWRQEQILLRPIPLDVID